MADFWGVVTTTTDGYNPLNSRAGGIRRRYTKISGIGIATGATPGPVVIRPTHLAWQTRAACFGMDRELFFDENDAHAEQLRPICNGCPVRQICSDYADDNRLVGFWGGRTQDERRRARQRARRGPKRTSA